MTAITFPNSPSSGDTHTAGNGIVYTYDGEKWTSIGTNSAGTWTRSGTEVSLTNAGDDLNVDSGTLFVDASTDRVGVGTSLPGSLLNLAASNDGISAVSSANNRLRFTDTDTAVGSNFQITGAIEFETSDSSSAGVQAYIAGESSTTGFGNLLFGTGQGGSASTKMFIQSDGSVGIGTTSVDRLLHVEGAGTSGTQIQIEGTSASAGLKFVPASGDNWELQATTNSALIAYNRTDGAERMRIDSSGNVGIGDTNPDRKLQVVHSSDALMRLGRSDASSHGSTDVEIKFSKNYYSNAVFEAASHRFEIQGAEKARIDSSGRLLVGTTIAGAGSVESTAIVGSCAIHSTGIVSVANNGTLDLSSIGTSIVGHLYVHSVYTANAAVRTSKIFFVAGRFTNAFTATQLSSNNGSSGGVSFTITNPNSNTLRFTNTSGATVSASMSFVGSLGF